MGAQVLMFGRMRVPAPSGFDDFWATCHPQRRVDKMRTRMEFGRLSDADKAAATAAMPLHVAHWAAQGTEPQHIPHPHRWLKYRRWEDELPGATPAGEDALVEACRAVESRRGLA